jgi:hypothetical protein
MAGTTAGLPTIRVLNTTASAIRIADVLVVLFKYW